MVKLIKFILCILFFMAIGVKSFGQFRGRVPMQRRDPMERVMRAPPPQRRLEQIKETFIARRLNLAPEQSKAFWPLYRQYVEDRTAVRIMMRENNSTNAPDGTVQLKKELAYETELVNIRKHYMDEFLKILTPEQLSELYKSEVEFNDEMVRQLSERGIKPVN